MRFALWGRKRRDRELQEEIQAHLTLAEREEMESGRTKKEAGFAARREFGNVSIAEETTRDMWGWRWLVDLSQDFHYAVRTLRQRPGFAAMALLTLALGVGATTVMFTLINGVLLKPLPYPQADRLVAVHGHSDTWNAAIYGEQNVAYPDFLDVQRNVRSLESAAALYTGGTVSEPGEPEYVDLREISANLFSVLRVNLAQGRAFLPEEDVPGGAPAMILSNAFWQRHFAGRPEALGASVVLDQKRYTVVGIAPTGFTLYGDQADVYTPIGQDAAEFLRSRGAHPAHVLARLRPDATLAQAQAELASIGRHQAHTATRASRSELPPRAAACRARAPRTDGCSGPRTKFPAHLLQVLIPRFPSGIGAPNVRGSLPAPRAWQVRARGKPRGPAANWPH